MFLDTVKQLLNDGLSEREDLFLIDLSVDSANHIRVILDGDNGVILKDCMFISRAIENNLDREEQDFSLEVFSAGASEPLTMPRQFAKNVGRTLEVKATCGSYEADLIEANDTEIKLVWKTREPKPVGKGKVTVTKEKVLAYGDITEAKVKIKF